ncbi:alpha/beta hydrolase [Agrococcus sp. ARC_14]|uniref:alpha/beta fold hydrolase n=1 Tax=Agrococcus sp. ARC_14 TaxID=2919927 RepID=UPI001F05886D|nr:alpha/beta hydrolase [Agrococcus sp. ARC_14]MCH1882620.1 alpha/beta hydrolase [Agrococcus sp. ARC_14]
MGKRERASLADWRAAADGTAGAVTAAHSEGDHTVIVHRWPKPGAATVVLVHGIGMGQQYFGLLRHKLTSSFEVVALDLPGFGASPEPTESLPMPALADLVADALRSLVPGSCIAVGHSMGTQVVAELAVRHPELVERVVLIAPTVNPAERSGWKQAMRLLQDLANDPPIVAAIGARLYAQAGPRWYLRKLRTMLGHDIRPLLPRIEQPTLVIRGEEDRVSPAAWVDEVVAALPDGRLRVAEDRGHEAMVTGAEPVSQMLEEFAR